MMEITPEKMIVDITFLTETSLDDLEQAFMDWEPSTRAQFKICVGEMNDAIAARLRTILASERALYFASRHVSFYVKFHQVTVSTLEHFFKKAEHLFPTDMTFACGLNASARMWGDALFKAMRQRRLGFNTTFDLSEAEASEEAIQLHTQMSDLVITTYLHVIYPPNVRASESVLQEGKMTHSNPPRTKWPKKTKAGFFRQEELTMIPEDQLSDEEETHECN